MTTKETLKSEAAQAETVQTIKVEIIDWTGKKVKDIDLPADIFGVDIRKDVVAEVVRYQLAKRRSGNHETKTRGDVRGTTKKCKPQKEQGTRHGDKRAPIFRKGGVVFGPHKRDHAFKLNKKLKQLGLKVALSDKVNAGTLKVFVDLKPGEAKTKWLDSKLSALQLYNALFVSEEFDAGFENALGNIPNTRAIKTAGINVYDILKHKNLVLTTSAIDKIIARFAS